MKKVILLAVIFLLIIPSVVTAKGDVSVTPHFHKDWFLTDGDSVSYSFTITNIGNDTIKSQKLWYDINPPSEINYYNLPAIDIPELEPGEKITLDSRGVHLVDVGAYTLEFGINSRGDKSFGNSVTVNGEMDTRNSVQDSFRTFDGNELVAITIGGIIGILGTILVRKFRNHRKQGG